MVSDFYVYEHWRPDTDLPFYVGKGKGSRAWDLGKRNNYHTNVVNKLAGDGLCIEVRLVNGGLTEDQAYAIEKERIAFWKTIPNVTLVNMTNGGEGLSDPTGEICKKISASLTGRKNGPLSLSTRMKISEKLQYRQPPSLETRAKMSESQKRRPPQSKETRLKKSLASKGRKLGPCPQERRIKIGNANRNPSEETRLKMSESAKKRKSSAETCAKISAALVARGSPSEETRAKIGASNKTRHAQKLEAKALCPLI